MSDFQSTWELYQQSIPDDLGAGKVPHVFCKNVPVK